MERKYLVLLGLGFELVVFVVVFLFAGMWLDQQMNWSGFGALGGAVLSLVIWLVHLAMVVKSLDSDEPKGGL